MIDEVTAQRIKKCANSTPGHEFVEDYNDDGQEIKVCIKCGLSIREN